MRSLRAVYRRVGFFGLVHLLAAGATAGDECPSPTLVFDGPEPETFQVPPGCPYMLVKAWGNGGNAGWPLAPVIGKGGGGAAVKAVYEVEAGQEFRARVLRNHWPNAGYNGRAAALETLSGDVLLLAAGGGGGGTSHSPSQAPHGGAGGAEVGQPGLLASTQIGDQTFILFPGLGGSEGQGGQGGAGYPQGLGPHGQSGGLYPCDPPNPTTCGQGGWGLGGHGGQGWFGGGGGGSDGGNISLAGAGGGGGASFVAEEPRALYSRRYAGNRETPGNPDDPDRQGHGEGGVDPSPQTGYAEGKIGRIVVRFNTLEIVPEESTRWKPLRADNDPIYIVFDSPTELQSAELEIRDPDGVPLLVDDQPLEELSTDPLHRYRLAWRGPWTRTVGTEENHLPAGNYRVVVRASPSGVTMKSEPYDRVSLVEVVSVSMRTHPAGQPLPGNPPVPGIPGQAPSQARLYEVPGQAAQPGLRIFAEAPSVSATEVRTVSVRIETFPTIADLPASAPPIVVNVRSFDVDDPVTGPDNFADMDLDADPFHVHDNRGSPGCGSLGDPALSQCFVRLSLPPGESIVTTTLHVSGQPGDNYRVGASTSIVWLEDLFGSQPSNFGEIRIPDGSQGTPLDVQGRACVSEMLTVWRTLHLELDTTTPFPTAPDTFQRNFIRGDVTEITVAPESSAGTAIVVRPMQTDPPLGLDDGSPNLTDGNGWGRFQSGTLELGTASLPFIVDGNGDFHVERAAGFNIPFQMFPPGSGLVLNGQVLRWNEQSLTFELSVNVPPLYNDGTLRIAGMNWTGVSVNGPLVTLPAGGDELLPVFRLWDDDRAALAAPTSDLLTPGTYQPARNILAQAYIEIASAPSSGLTAPFVRNLTSSALPQQLCLGRDATTVHLARHWSAYIQGTYQASTLADDDPENESASATMGVAAPQHNSATVFLETVRDAAENPHATCPYGPLCAPWTAVSGVAAHELGHVLGASHDDGDIMSNNPACPCPLKRFFSAKSLNRIRQFTGPATPAACVFPIVPNEDSGASSEPGSEPGSSRR